MSSTTSFSAFNFIFDAALSDYTRQTGVDLATYPFAQTLQSCHDLGAILELLQDRVNQYRACQEGNRKLIRCLKPLVKTLHLLSGVLAPARAHSMVSPVNDCVLSDLIFMFSPPGYISTCTCDSCGCRCSPRRMYLYVLSSTSFI